MTGFLPVFLLQKINKIGILYIIYINENINKERIGANYASIIKMENNNKNGTEEINMVLDKCKGWDNEDLSSNSVTTYNIMEINGGKAIPKESLTIDTAEVNIMRTEHYLMLDLMFDKTAKEEIEKIWNIFERYGRMVEAFNISGGTTLPPVMTVVLQPKYTEDNYNVVLSTPRFWNLQSKTFGGEQNTIRVTFIDKDIAVYKYNLE